MLEQINIENIRGTTVYGAEGEKIGKVGEVYLADQTNQPEWATVNTKLFGGNQSFVPLSDASITGDRLSLPYDKETVKDAPNIGNDGHLTPDEERQLYAHYGLSYDSYSTGRGTDNDDNARYDTAGRDTAGAMTRSEEQVDVGTRAETAGRARLRKYVVTENETHTVPVRKERAVLETEPITSDNYDEATRGSELTEDEHEVILSEERPVVSKSTQPVERVRLGTQTTTDEETVTEEVRKERIEAEGDIARESNR
ncbi:MAG: DUF2382 domain-containing protein [Nocardioidaceae bacterium]